MHSWVEKKQIISCRSKASDTVEAEARTAGEATTEASKEEEEEEERTEGCYVRIPQDAVTEKMMEDFTLSDLVDLAKRCGLKQEGVNWGKNGTPIKRKSKIIADLITKHSEEAKEAVRERVQDGIEVDIDTGHWMNFYVEEGRHVPAEFMSRTKYRDHLVQTVRSLEHDQHVFHIIASANGGPDHPDNYLGALGASFNCSLGAKMDFFCAFIAGVDKTQKAVQRALEAERLFRMDPSSYKNVIDRRGKERPTLYSENRYNLEAGRCLTAVELVERGRLAWFRMRLAGLEACKEAVERGVC